jgi:hypothetical protein
VLDGSDDPPAVKSSADVGNVWYPHARSFSEFVCAEVFDYRLYVPPARSAWARVAECLGGEHLQALRAEFAAGPTTIDTPGELTLRFVGRGQRLRVSNHYPAGFSSWRVWAAGDDEFDALLARLGRVDPGLAYLAPPPPAPDPAPAAPSPAPDWPPVVPGSDEIPF